MNRGNTVKAINTRAVVRSLGTHNALRGVVAPCYQHHHRRGVDNKVPQLHPPQSEPLD